MSQRTPIRRHDPQIQNYGFTTPIHNTNKAENIKFIKEFMRKLHNIGSPSGLRRNAEHRNSPTKQCSKAIAPVKYLQPDEHDGSPILDGQLRNTHCWLCGHPLIRLPSGTHCEHLLPVIYATLYSGIINRELNNPSNETHNNVDMDKLTKMAQTNYAWAHGWCNIVKSDIMLIKANPKTGYSIVDISNCDILADRIIKKVELKREAEVKNTYSNKLKPDSTYKKELLFHYKKVLDKMCQPINDELDVYTKEYANHNEVSGIKLDINTHIANARREYLSSCLYLSHLYFYKKGQIELNYTKFKDAYNTYIHSIEWKFPPNAPIKELPAHNSDNFRKDLSKTRRILFNEPVTKKRKNITSNNRFSSTGSHSHTKKKARNMSRSHTIHNTHN